MEQKCTSTTFNQALGFDLCLNQITLTKEDESVLSMILMNLDGPFHFDVKFLIFCFVSKNEDF